ncbi:MAG TPA: hypothetical protein VKP08_03145 [Anaerolineales bacterium]|nr:hypothetical protein [Anaerolineales bacterium]
MNRNHFHLAASTVVLLAAMLACELPGQTMQPAPVINIETAVAGTAEAAAQQTAAAQPVPTHRTGTILNQLEDGSTLYTDYDAGFEILFPAGWLAVRANAEEFQTVMEKEGAVNFLLHAQMTDDLATLNGETKRVFAYALRPDIETDTFFGFAKAAWYQDDLLSIDNATMSELMRSLEASNDLPGFHADTAQLHEDGPVKMIEIGGPFAQTTDKGKSIFLYSTFIYFKPSTDSTARLLFTVFDKFRGLIAPDVKSIFESIRLIES